MPVRELSAVSPAPAALRPAHRRRVAAWSAAVAAVLLLAAGDRILRLLAAPVLFPTGAAVWIWTGDSPRRVGPRAFYAVRDFPLASPPEQARLSVLADEEYILYLNGLRVGSNRYSAGAPLDAYQVGGLLLPGANRLVAELRSSRGTGGLLLRLESGGRDLVVSDDGWRIFATHHPGILGGWYPVGRGEEPRVWGPPPVGRWTAVAAGALRPIHSRATASPPAAPREVLRVPAAGVGPGEEWVVWDWGREVVGYLVVEYRRHAPAAGLLFAGSEPPLPALEAADGFIATPEGSPSWEDAVVRRFRYAAVVGPGRIEAVGVAPVEPALAAALAPLPDERGLFGLEVPRRLSPVERQVGGRPEG